MFDPIGEQYKHLSDVEMDVAILVELKRGRWHVSRAAASHSCTSPDHADLRLTELEASAQKLNLSRRNAAGLSDNTSMHASEGTAQSCNLQSPSKMS